MPQLAVKAFWLDDPDWPQAAVSAAAIVNRVGAVFWRTGDERLVLERATRRVRPGLKTSQGDEKVSARFDLDWSDWNLVQTYVSSQWLANKSAPAATLMSAINTRLQAIGYRGHNGEDLA